MIFREVEDRDLIERARRGDVDAFNVLVSRWERRVYAFLARSVGNREDALDLCQDVFLKAYRGLTRLDDVDRFASWLFRIARNETISAHRRAGPTMAGEEEIERSSESTAAARSLGNRAELSLIVEQALGRLPAEQREAVILKVYEGFKFHEIADIVQAPLSTVKSRVYSGFEALKLALAPAEADRAPR